MPLEGEKLDELLSGFLDDQLTEAELKLVEQALSSDSAVSQRLDDLRQQRRDVAELAELLAAQVRHNRPQHIRQPGSRDTLATVVIARARQQAEQLGLPPDHHVYGRESAPAVSPARVAPTNTYWQRRRLWTGAAVTAIAMLLTVGLVWRVQWENGDAVPLSDSGTLPALAPDGPPARQSVPTESLLAQSPLEKTLPEPDTSGRPVGQFGQLAYVLVVDVQLTSEGLQKRVLDDVLAGAGIPQSEPVLANSDILAALEQSRMIVDPQSKPVEQIFLTVIRADMRDIDAALQNIWNDNLHFPKVSLNIAIDARAALVREILNSTGRRFTLSESFAVPVASDEQPPQLAGSTPFPATSEGVHYISNSRRADGWAGSEALAVPPSETLASILLVTHLVQ